MVRRRTAKIVLTRRSRQYVSQDPIPGTQGVMAEPSGGMWVGAPWPMAMPVTEPAGHKERVASPRPLTRSHIHGCNTPGSNAPGWGHRSHARSVGKKANPQNILAAKYASFPVVTPYAVSTRATQDPHLCSSDCTRNYSVVWRRCRRPRHRFNRCAATAGPPPLLPLLRVIKTPHRQQARLASNK